MANVSESQRPYESLFIVPPEIPQETVEQFVEKLKSTISENGGTVKGVQLWGRRRLAYPIRQHKEGVYIYVDFDGAGTSTGAIDGLFRVTDFVIRHITVVREEAPIDPRGATPRPGEAAAAPRPADAGATPAAGAPASPPTA